jgi:hypothetical protein
MTGDQFRFEREPLSGNLIGYCRHLSPALIRRFMVPRDAGILQGAELEQSYAPLANRARS